MSDIAIFQQSELITLELLKQRGVVWDTKTLVVGQKVVMGRLLGHFVHDDHDQIDCLTSEL